MSHADYRAYSEAKHQPIGYHFETDAYDHFQMIYVCDGELVFSALNRTAKLGPDSMVLLRRGSSFSLSCPARGYTGVCFQAIGEIPGAFSGPARIATVTAEHRTLARLMQMELRRPGPEAAEVLAGLGRTMAWLSVRLDLPAHGPGGAGEWAQAAKAALDATLHTGLSARSALRGLSMSYRQLSRTFESAFGCTPKVYQQRARLAEAKRLLAQTDMPVTAVAMELGYCSSQHFATIFRRATGRAPSAWREGEST